MSRRDISLWDVANAGMNAYNIRQTGRLRSEMAEQNAMMQSELEQMRMAQEMEAMNKQMIVQARNMILEVEEEINRIETASHQYPAHSSLTLDILEKMLDDSGIESNIFEEISDIERFRQMQVHMVEASTRVSRLSQEDIEIKTNLIRYTAEEDELVEAIKLTENREITSVEFEENTRKWEEAQPEWGSLNKQIKEKRSKFNKIVSVVVVFGLIAIGAAYAVMVMATDLLDTEIMEYLMYSFCGLGGILLLVSSAHRAKPFVGKDHPLLLLKASLPKLEKKLEYLNEKYESIPHLYEGRTTSEELRELHTSWLQYVDQHSPLEGEQYEAPPAAEPLEFAPVLESPSGPQKPRGPPEKRPSIDRRGSVDDDGYEWIEFPESSDKWFYRASSDQPWDDWEG